MCDYGSKSYYTQDNIDQQHQQHETQGNQWHATTSTEVVVSYIESHIQNRAFWLIRRFICNNWPFDSLAVLQIFLFTYLAVQFIKLSNWIEKLIHQRESDGVLSLIRMLGYRDQRASVWNTNCLFNVAGKCSSLNDEYKYQPIRKQDQTRWQCSTLFYFPIEQYNCLWHKHIHDITKHPTQKESIVMTNTFQHSF